MVDIEQISYLISMGGIASGVFATGFMNFNIGAISNAASKVYDGRGGQKTMRLLLGAMHVKTREAIQLWEDTGEIVYKEVDSDADKSCLREFFDRHPMLRAAYEEPIEKTPEFLRV